MIVRHADVRCAGAVCVAQSVRDVDPAAAPRGPVRGRVAWGDCQELARTLGDVLRRLNKALETPPYTLVIHSAPVADGLDFYHWHIEILPR